MSSRLSKNLYGSDVRFIFELLQNADDNKFSEAIKMEAVPSITFKVYKSHIVVECNEDGFTEPDLTAICHVGESTKSNDYGYIGAKGIGFKSVFVAATEVYIQSGNFSFKFEHGKDDPGLGMVRPIWVDPKETLAGPLTRMTLRLHGDESGSEDVRSSVIDQLDTLQESCLLFLKNLQCIRTEHYEDDNLFRSTEFKKATVDDFRTRLIRSSVSEGQETTKSQLYHVTKVKAHELPWSLSRDSPTSETAKAEAASAEVVLAFPLTEEFVPVCTVRQNIFAFLPLCLQYYKVSEHLPSRFSNPSTNTLKFIIHSDFDTKGDREDIIITSRRNKALRKWIATAFVTAILEFCEHSILCYQWPLFLPDLEESKWDSFWVGLNSDIRQQLGEAKVLKSRVKGQLRRISDLRHLPANGMFDGEPMFDDNEKDIFTSPKYVRTKKILMSYGLKSLDLDEFFDLVKKDLNSPKPRLQGNSTELWQSAVAKLFCHWFDTKPGMMQRLGSLSLIPLVKGHWTSANETTAYFPTTDGFDIPHGLDLEIVDPKAVANPDRRTLFTHLGVSTALIRDVQSSIIRAFAGSMSVSVRKCHHFLYYTHLHRSSVIRPSQMGIVNDSFRLVSVRTNDIYLHSSTDPYSAKVLLAASGSAPGLAADFTHALYMVDVPSPPSPVHPTWERWLYDFLGVREHLRLVSPRTNEFSGVLNYLLKYRALSVLGLLAHLQHGEASQLCSDKVLREKMRHIEAKNMCGVTYSILLQDTWLPLPTLEKRAEYFLDSFVTEPDKGFPFLRIDLSETAGQVDSKWQFLYRHFSVGHEENLKFLLALLSCICRLQGANLSVAQAQRVYDLYVTIAAKHATEMDSRSTAPKIKYVAFFLLKEKL